MRHQLILEMMTKHVGKRVVFRSMLIGGIADEVNHFASRVIDKRTDSSAGSHSTKTSL